MLHEAGCLKQDDCPHWQVGRGHVLPYHRGPAALATSLFGPGCVALLSNKPTEELDYVRTKGTANLTVLRTSTGWPAPFCSE
eukprot:11491914-Heterocapsa_arctica.AAC.1